ncbi:alginate export family protein [Methylophaga sp. OBS3]|uniref:alginate export family protein n=1 Tax=Methylophaga sp. OBS3 TaxID=2991934 RepID=UPI0022535C28|nr:alginate export family protein [Methylophaga sp. OBS3]MCX4188994.1 alginate export family protein [Methylophaga sp. OBS3]
MSMLQKPVSLAVIAAGLSSMSVASNAMAEDAFIEALTGGKVSFSARARYEHVDQDNALKNAEALTLRTSLGYKTGAFHGFSGFIEFQDVSHLGSDRFNAAGTNGEPDYSVVADPEGTDVNQAYLAFNGFDTEFRFGRQEITYRQAPFHRFIGNILWRQNHQSFDAFSVTNKSFENLTLNYAYIDEVHTIFGDDKTDAAALIFDGDIAMDSHLFNVQYTGLPIGTLEGYTYLLDYEDSALDSAFSRATYGARLSGAKPLNDAFTMVYTAEYATQDDYADGEMDQQDYYLLELGTKYKGWLVKLSHEVQEGDGTFSFRTPLGTNHAFQGWADMFLATPTQGLEDTFVTVVGNVFGAKLVVAYHDFETDEGSLDAGNELDVMLSKTFNKHYTLELKYADYNADSEYSAVNPMSVDTEKFWLTGSISF